MKNHFSKCLLIFFLLACCRSAIAQSLLPFCFKNTSEFKDEELYVAIVGEDLSGPPGAHIWIDCKTGAQLPMSSSYNTVEGPVYGGNKGPGTNGKYAACFTKLSEVPNKTVMLPPIQGCRLFISKGSQLFFYFFGSTGAPSGYTSPSSTDPTDPNTGILYEIIELTYNQYGFWGNTSRVDSYNYALGLQLSGKNGSKQKAGELKTHAAIGAAFMASAPTPFKGCYNPNTGQILFPTKTAGFADGLIGTMPNVGPYVDYMKPYIDSIWTKYSKEDLIFSTGDAGIWKGSVQSNDELIMVCQTQGAFFQRKGIVSRRPTTQEAFEGKGVLDHVVQDATTDLLIQAQLCAAISRHVINTTTLNVGQQDWSDPARYYKLSPCNYYTKFWHEPGISVNQRSYGFAYDDVFNQSSTLYDGTPTKVVVLFGGFATDSSALVKITSPSELQNFPPSTGITITADVKSQGSIVKVIFYEGTTQIGEDNLSPYSFNWTGAANGSHPLMAKAIENTGDTVVSEIVTVVVGNGGTTAVAAGDHTGSGLLLFPNPLLTEMNVSSDIDLSNALVVVLDALGRKVFSGIFTSEPIPVSSLSSGIYTVIVTKGDQRFSKKIVKQ